MTGLSAMLGLAAVSWLLRIALVALVPADRLPRPVRQGLDHLPPAVLAALVAVDLAGTTESGSALGAGLVLGATAVLWLVARLSRSMTAAVTAALAAALLIDLVVHA